ncbi:hypothetical protein ACWGNZ_00880 [Sphingomonas zeae]
MIETLIARAVAVRAAQAEASRQDLDRRLGMTAMRPFIDHLDSEVLPALEEAKSRLAAASIVLTIERQYAEDMQGRRPAIAMIASVGEGWTLGQYAKSDRVEIHHDRRGTRVVTKPITDPESVGTAIEDAGDPIATAIAHTVNTLLDRAEAAPRCTGTVMRSHTGRG